MLPLALHLLPRGSSVLHLLHGPWGVRLELPTSIAGDKAVKGLCKEINLDPHLVELGHLILFNLEFLTK